MAETKLQVKIDAAINAAPTLASLKELRGLLKQIPADSDNFKKVTQRMNDISDSIKTAKGQSEDLVDSLASAPGPIGMLARGYDQLTSSTNKWGLAWKATGIGLLVALVGQLVTAFTSNEKAMKKLEPVMIAFEQILGGIFEALQPVFDTLIELIMWVMPGVQKAIGAFYTVLVTLGSFLKNFFQVQIKNFAAFGKILKGVFTLDFDMVKEGVNDVVNNFKAGFEDIKNTATTTWDNYNKGLSNLTKTQKKNLDEQNKNSKEALEAAKKLIESDLKERESQIAKQKALAMAGAKTEEERLALEKKFAEDSYLAKKQALEKTRALYPQGSQEYKDYTSQLTALEAEYIGKKTEFRNKDQELAQKAFQDEVKAAQQANKAKVDDLTNTYNLQKQLYGENSKEARMAQDQIFAAQMQGLENEKKLYDSKKELTNEEKQRLVEIELAQKQLTTNIQIENDKRLKSDVETALKSAEEQKKIRDEKFANDFKAAENNLELQQQLLDAKIEQDRLHYEKLLAQENLTAEQRKKIEDDYTKSKQANADAQISIEQKKFDAQQKLLQATAAAISAVGDIIGKNTVAGKALAVAASLINTYSAIAGQLKAFSGVPVPGYAIAQAIATGLVGFKAVADIVKTPVPGGAGTAEQPRQLASGGYVSGPGGPKSDMIPAMLSNGESVINAQSTAMFRPLLSTINSIGGGKRFAEGGVAVGGFSQAQAMGELQNALMASQTPIKTYVVASDMSNQQMMDRAIKSRSTL